jgi:hypothetical protein
MITSLMLQEREAVKSFFVLALDRFLSLLRKFRIIFWWWWILRRRLWQWRVYRSIDLGGNCRRSWIPSPSFIVSTTKEMLDGRDWNDARSCVSETTLHLFTIY